MQKIGPIMAPLKEAEAARCVFLPIRAGCVALATYEAVESGANQAVSRVLADASARRTGTHEEREERKKHLQSTRKALIDICRSEASKYLVVGEFEFAVRGMRRTCAAIRAPSRHWWSHVP